MLCGVGVRSHAESPLEDESDVRGAEAANVLEVQLEPEDHPEPRDLDTTLGELDFRYEVAKKSTEVLGLGLRGEARQKGVGVQS